MKLELIVVIKQDIICPCGDFDHEIFLLLLYYMYQKDFIKVSFQFYELFNRLNHSRDELEDLCTRATFCLCCIWFSIFVYNKGVQGENFKISSGNSF